MINMFRIIKFRYTWKRTGDGFIYQTITPIGCLEGKGDTPFLGNKFYKLVARDQWTGAIDKNKNDIYENDIVICGRGKDAPVAKIVFKQQAFLLQYLPLKDKIFDHMEDYKHYTIIK